MAEELDKGVEFLIFYLVPIRKLLKRGVPASPDGEDAVG